MEQEAGACVELHRAIPIPAEDVPLAEILEFRHRHNDELLILRQHIDSFVSEIDAATDKPAALGIKVADIDKACANLLALGREWKFPVYLSNLKASFSLSPQKFLPAVAGGWKLGEPYGLPTASAVAAAAGIASTLEIKGDFGFSSIRRPLNPFRYAYTVHKELT